MGLRHYPGYQEIRICEEHTRTTGCIPTTHERRSILPHVFKQHLHSCHFLCVTDTQSVAMDQHSELYNILWKQFVAYFPTNGTEEMYASERARAFSRNCLHAPQFQLSNQMTNFLHHQYYASGTHFRDVISHFLHTE